MQRIDIDGAYDLKSTFALLSMGAGDPCLQFDGDRQMRMAMHTPSGPVAFVIQRLTDGVSIDVSGVGADKISPCLPSLLGLNFQPPRFDQPDRLRRLSLEHAGLRLPILPAISLRLVQIILQQLVSFRDACFGWRQLVHRHGSPVPGHTDLWFPPSPKSLRTLATHQFVECAILPQHGRRVLEAMRHTKRLEQTWGGGSNPDAAKHTIELLEKIRGIGPWTRGFLSGAGLGDADAEILGDYGHAKQVGYFFEGTEDANDDDMLRLLEPYRPFRFYALALIVLGAPRPPRRGPKRAPLRHRLQARR